MYLYLSYGIKTQTLILWLFTLLDEKDLTSFVESIVTTSVLVGIIKSCTRTFIKSNSESYNDPHQANLSATRASTEIIDGSKALPLK